MTRIVRRRLIARSAGITIARDADPVLDRRPAAASSAATSLTSIPGRARARSVTRRRTTAASLVDDHDA